MPTLIRFLSLAGITGAICFGVMLFFAYAIKPEPREMSVTIPQAHLVLKPVSQASKPDTKLKQP